jgi:sec-independent protein translocase protein TatC
MRLLLALAGLAIGVVASLLLGRQIIAFIQAPYVKVVGSDATLQTLAPAQGIASYMRISLITGLLVSSPWVFYHLWMFVAAGLYPHERRYVYVAVPFSVALFITGALFFMFVVARLSLAFLIKFDVWLGLKPTWTFPKYVTFVSLLMLVFGVAFQTPLVIFVLNRAGLVSLDRLRSSRKYVLLAMFVIAAVVTPPDFISQVTLAVPLYLLFELGILLSSISKRKSRSQQVSAK